MVSGQMFHADHARMKSKDEKRGGEMRKPRDRSGQYFAQGAGPRPRGKKALGDVQSFDSDTERRRRSLSRSNSSLRTRSREHAAPSPDGRVNGSIETLPDPSPSIPYWSAKRHLTCGNPTPGPSWSSKTVPWRGSSPGKLKTASAVLVLCLNLEVDPPDIFKTNPCAVHECWVDPQTMPSQKAAEAIGKNLQHQFEGLSQKITYTPMLDPWSANLGRYCQSLRKQTKDDAILFYYNGHGVPKPTMSGEFWCFNESYTQYIPVSLKTLQQWLGSPGVYIWDCSSAGYLLKNFNDFAKLKDEENMMQGGYGDGTQPFMNSLQLAACAANEQLPTFPELPADLFTSCLTSPIDMALRYFIMNHQLPNNITADMVFQVPGDLKDRRTPLGELNWIFTAITDTIAWTTFSRDIFTKLYRCDLLIASLFRNFLLAERIMKNFHCNPHTYPPLPATNTHALWDTWDLAVDTCLRQLPDLLKRGTKEVLVLEKGTSAMKQRSGASLMLSSSDKPGVYVPSRFFADQLTAFEVWISRGGSALTKRGPMSLPTPSDSYPSEMVNRKHVYDGAADQHLVPRKPPDQLPIVLQVLLSQPHRLRALILLSQFVDLGPWAVHLVLTIGIFPYISKLLQAAGQELQPVLIFIWARILAVDPSVQTDLYNNRGYKYFANVLGLKNDDNLPNSSEHKAMCSFILAATSRGTVNGQAACWSERVFDNCYDRLEEPDFLLRQWTALCIAQMWDGNNEIKVYGVDRGTQDKLIGMLADDSAEVRCAAMYALGTFLGASGSLSPTARGGGGSGSMYQLEDERIHFRMEVTVATGATLAIKDDASPMCRKELLVVISCLVKEWRGYFVVCAWLYWEEDRKWRSGTTGHHWSSIHDDDDVTNQAVNEWLDGFGDDEMLREENRVLLSSFFTIFVVLLNLSVDPYNEVATNAQTIVDYIMALLLESPFSRLEGTSLKAAPPMVSTDRRASPLIGVARSRVTSFQSAPSNSAPPLSERPLINRTDTMTSSISTGVSNTMRRTSSFANALKTLANGIAFPTLDEGRSTSPGLTSPHHSLIKSDSIHFSRPPSPNLNMAQYSSPYAYPPSHLKSNQIGRKDSHSAKFMKETEDSEDADNSDEPRPVEFQPYDAMEALMEEDMERLRARRKIGLHSKRHHQYGSGSILSPSNSTFSMDSTASSVMLGLGTGAGIQDVLPLKSNFFDWACEYFKEPQMRQAEVDEPGSIQYNYQVWRQQRNEKLTNDTLSLTSATESCRWDRNVSTLQISGHPLTMAFHSHDSHLVISNESDTISVWDWFTKRKLSQFCNGNSRGTSITSLHIINQDVGGLIVASSSDGIVRLYRNYDPTLEQGPLQMVSAFRGLHEVIQCRQGSGMVTDWKQSAGSLTVGGDSRIIKSWDAQTETHGLASDLETHSESPVTAIVSDSGVSQTFLASFGDGVVKVFDRRLEYEESIVRIYSEHTSWVQNVRWHPQMQSQFFSASIDGKVKLWDIRGSPDAIQTWEPYLDGLSAFDVHSISGVFATSSAISPTNWRSQRVNVQSFTKEEPLSVYNVSTGLSAYTSRTLPSQFIPRVSSLMFHPMEMIYAVGGPDGTVRVMGCKLPSAK